MIQSRREVPTIARVHSQLNLDQRANLMVFTGLALGLLQEFLGHSPVIGSHECKQQQRPRSGRSLAQLSEQRLDQLPRTVRLTGLSS